MKNNSSRNHTNLNILMFVLGIWTSIFSIILYLLTKKSTPAHFDNITSETQATLTGNTPPETSENRLQNSSVLIEGFLAILFLVIAVSLGFYTTSSKGSPSVSEDHFFWNVTPQHDLDYSATITMTVLPDSDNVSVNVSTNPGDITYLDPDYLEKTAPYRVQGEQKTLTVIWPENVEYDGDVTQIEGMWPSDGYQMEATQFSFPDINFLWLNGAKRLSFAEKIISLRFGNIVTSNFDDIEAIGLPFIREKIILDVYLPTYYKVVSEKPAANQNILITKTYFWENSSFREYIIEVGYGGTDELAVHANTDFELIIEDTRLSRFRDILIMLVGILFGIGSNLLTNVIIAVYNQRTSKKKAG